MQPIIRRTITITITETWTITWQDGQETVWHTTREVAWPDGSAPEEALLPTANDEEGEPVDLEPDATAPPAAIVTTD